MPPTLPAELLRAVQQRKCILFVGSGLSSAAGYPTWSELADRLVKEARQIPYARVQGLDEIEDQKDYFTLAEFARATLGNGHFADVLKEMLAAPVHAPHPHRVIAHTDYRGIITTNYDKLLETVITQVRGWMPNVFTSRGLEQMGSALFDSNLFVYKMHGDVVEAGGIVISASDYDRMIIRSPHARSFLHAALLNHTLLFVGYSLRDPDFQLVLRELSPMYGDYLPRHYALIPNAGDFTAEHLLRRLNVQALSYDPAGGHAEAIEVLEALQRLSPYEHPRLAVAS
ncbi:MAG TPA: SIR2 family protein [Longimicrobium sp.]|nr:SIR2 family protein [Longimicrobium sp.]